MFLTVQEAIDISGKSQTTIHRLCQKHDGTKFIRKERNKYLIDKDFLLEKYPAENKEVENLAVVNSGNGDSELQEEFAEKSKQINELNEEKAKLAKENAELSLENVELAKDRAELSEQAADLAEQIKKKDAKIAELEDEIFDNQHELAEALDANMHLGQELQALKHISDTLLNPPENQSEQDEADQDFDIDARKKAIRYTISGITISAVILIAFIFMMYYLTK